MKKSEHPLFIEGLTEGLNRGFNSGLSRGIQASLIEYNKKSELSSAEKTEIYAKIFEMHKVYEKPLLKINIISIEPTKQRTKRHSHNQTT